jgi:hypothetical protein
MSAQVARGATFTHDRMLDPTWRPAPGQRYADGPKARMVVTRVAGPMVWYGYVGAGRAGWRMDRDEFVARFGGSLDTQR